MNDITTDDGPRVRGSKTPTSASWTRVKAVGMVKIGTLHKRMSEATEQVLGETVKWRDGLQMWSYHLWWSAVSPQHNLDSLGKRVSTRGTLSWPVGTFIRDCVNKVNLYGRHNPLWAAPFPRWGPQLCKSRETEMSAASIKWAHMCSLSLYSRLWVSCDQLS